VTDPAVITDAPAADHDALAVDRTGGHVLQSAAWAEHRRASGWRPRFVSWREHRVLALTRDWPVIGGSSAYVPRGPVPASGGRETGVALWTVATALRAEGGDVLAADPEVRADDDGYREVLAKARFHPIEEIQPSRHKVALTLTGADEDGALSHVAKSTRQRIRRAEKDRTVVVRHDQRAEPPEDGFCAPVEPADAAFDRFYDLLLATGERKHFTFGPRDAFVGWWRRAHDAGHLVYLEARDGEPTGDVLGGLLLYRHGGRLSTVHSGDPEDRRRSHPGTMHLLRWRAIQLAIREGRAEMDLGGVDVAGARRRPAEGEPMYGLLEHKLSFGAAWVELAGAQERVHRPIRNAAGRVISAVSRRLRR
jgi:lipid II:glycine glycyltransferase (peptidoglycan interpeptide bridge formation enzyme)